MRKKSWKSSRASLTDQAVRLVTLVKGISPSTTSPYVFIIKTMRSVNIKYFSFFSGYKHLEIKFLQIVGYVKGRVLGKANMIFVF